MDNYLIGIDAGNTSSKVVLFDELGRIIASDSTPSMHFERRGEGFEEFDIDELWSEIVLCIRNVVQNSGVSPEKIKGVGVTSFGNGVVFVGKNGETIAPGCFSQDFRANEILKLYEQEGVISRINEIVKGTIFAGEPAPILRWYKEHEPETYEKIGGILTFKDYIIYKLTGELATDLNCFGGSLMLDMETMDYSDELMELYGISELTQALPRLAEPTEIVGYVTDEVAAETCLKAGTPVVAGMMDILASLVGAGATGDNVYTAVAGSWCINETHSDRIIDGASSNMPYLHRGEYLNCSYTGASGSNYEWFTRVLGDSAKVEAKDRGLSYYDVLDEYIEQVNPEEAVVMFSPFVAQPSIHMNAKANFLNIDTSTTYAELCYAVAEGCAFIHKHHIDFLRDAGLPLDAIHLTGGTARSKVWNQIFANVLEVPIVGVDCEETGALGVAIAAGIGAGVYEDYDDAFSKAVKTLEPVAPDPETFETYRKRYAEWQYLNDILAQYWESK